MLLLDYIKSKFPVTSKPLALLSNRIPDNNSSDYDRISSADLLQPDEQEGNEETCLPASSTTRGRRSFSLSARLELLLGRVRRWLGRHRRGKPSVRSLDSKPKGTLHQPQGDDGSAERPLRVQLSSQRQDDHSLLRQCHDSRLPQAIGRHEVSGPVPQSEGDSPVGRIHEDHATSPVLQGSLNTRADLLSRPSLVIGSEWTLHQEVVQDLLHQWPAIIDLFATSLTARLPVFFAPAWEPKAAGVDAFLQPWDNLQAYAFPPIAIITRVLLKLRASHNCDLTLIAPFWPQREWFPALLDLLSDISMELP